MYVSDRSREISDRVLKAFWNERPEAGIQMLEGLLLSEEGLTPDERACLTKTLNFLLHAADPDFVPASTSNIDEAGALVFRSNLAAKAGNYPAAIADLWLYVQQCPVGTISLMNALDSLASMAQVAGDAKLARFAVEMWLSHYDMMSRVSQYVPLTKPEQSLQNGDDPESEPLYTPWSVALEYIQSDPEPCWLRILTLEAFTASPERRKERYFKKVLDALYQYSTHGNDQAEDVAALFEGRS
jgi:hypothetical protein